MYGIGTGTASAADVQIFALPAFPLVRLEIAQIIEQFRFLPYFTERSLFDISGGAVEIRAGFYVAETVDQADGLCGNASLAASGGEGQ